MQKAENGKFVSVHYTGTLDNGDVFDTSQDRQPLEFEMGKGNMIQGFENAVRGMTLNESKTFTLAPEEAYGDRDENLMRSFPRANVPPDMHPEVGQTVVLQSEQGQQIPAAIRQVDDEKIMLDLNHPLAGQPLTFEVTVVDINDTPVQPQNGCGAPAGCSPDCSC